jgi:hypothetical protein
MTEVVRKEEHPPVCLARSTWYVHTRDKGFGLLFERHSMCTRCAMMHASTAHDNSSQSLLRALQETPASLNRRIRAGVSQDKAQGYKESQATKR